MIRTIIWGLVIIAIGTWIWLAKLGIITSGIVFSRDWPVIIIIVGLLTVGEGISWIFRRGRKRCGG
ncbi:hypothetical protein FJY68_04320 [candidate division WOR-3 bacterium]|uniref:LiaI-LiaF-like transmembrane region domain-containing protein n=1 Tax=candidate division WOR-3 bacterium TaxID=2052148 RepID=A0A938BSZ0_UNCW3|nr:hypothetical protein [candidate division WOR-3 bacterium]